MVGRLKALDDTSRARLNKLESGTSITKPAPGIVCLYNRLFFLLSPRYLSTLVKLSVRKNDEKSMQDAMDEAKLWAPDNEPIIR